MWQNIRKSCSKCKKLLSLVFFYPNKYHKYGRCCQCTACMKKSGKYSVPKELYKPYLAKCVKCGATNLEKPFFRYKKSKSGFDYRCKECYKKDSKIYSQNMISKPKVDPGKSKKCTKCLVDKSIDNFFKNSKTKDGVNYWCKSCCNKSQKRHRDKLKNKEIQRIKQDEKRCRKCDVVKPAKEFYDLNRNKDGLDTYCKKCRYAFLKAYHKDPKNKLRRAVSIRINDALKSRNGSKCGLSIFDALPYTKEDLYDHLIWSLSLLSGYSEEDWIDGKLEIDHIDPNCLFNYNNMEDPEFLDCWSLTNLRLLPAKENRSKNGRFIPGLRDWFREQMVKDGRME